MLALLVGSMGMGRRQSLVQKFEVAAQMVVLLLAATARRRRMELLQWGESSQN